MKAQPCYTKVQGPGTATVAASREAIGVLEANFLALVRMPWRTGSGQSAASTASCYQLHSYTEAELHLASSQNH